MSQLEINQPTLRIPGTQISLFERAPLEHGRKRGYFRDEATRALLGLSKGDFLQASGTYGAREVAEYPVDFALLRDGTYDQRFLPFVPESRGTMRPVQVELRLHNKQWKPVVRALKNLQENLHTAMAEAEKVARLTNLPIPDYAFELVPRLCYQISPDDTPFELQFQIWFAPQAHCARWRRIERVTNLLDGYVNACYRLLNPGGPGWTCSEPVGINFDPTTADDNDRSLALAYAYLKVPISLPSSWAIPENYSVHDARAALFSDGRGSAKGRLSFATLPDLPETDPDTLTFTRVRPNYSEHRYNADGSRLTKQQCKEQEQEESTDMAEDEGSEIGSIGDAPFPADKITEVMEEEQPTDERSTGTPPNEAPIREVTMQDVLATETQTAKEPLDQPLDDLHLSLPTAPARVRSPTLQLDTAISLIPPSSVSNPTSASTSTPVSAVSSASSANAPLQPRSEAPSRRDRAARRQHRSSGYQRSRPTPRPQAGREDWEHYFERQEARGVSYEGPSAVTSRTAGPSAIIPRPSITDLSPARVLPQFRVVDVQAQPLLLHDTASNQLVETAVLSTDFSQSALLQHALQQQQQQLQQAPLEYNRSVPRERERDYSPPTQASHKDRPRGQRREYRQRSPTPERRRRSPPRGYRERSPPPRERRQSSRRYSPSQDREYRRERPREGQRSEQSWQESFEGHPTAWGSSTPSFTTPPSAPTTSSSSAPSRKRNNAPGSTSRRE